jgi:hypothetical protein
VSTSTHRKSRIDRSRGGFELHSHARANQLETKFMVFFSLFSFGCWYVQAQQPIIDDDSDFDGAAGFPLSTTAMFTFIQCTMPTSLPPNYPHPFPRRTHTHSLWIFNSCALAPFHTHPSPPQEHACATPFQPSTRPKPPTKPSFHALHARGVRATAVVFFLLVFSGSRWGCSAASARGC